MVIDEVFALLGRYAAWTGGSLLPSFRDILSVPSLSAFDCLIHGDGANTLSRNVDNELPVNPL